MASLSSAQKKLMSVVKSNEDPEIQEEMQKVSGVKKAPVTPINQQSSSEESSSEGSSSGEEEVQDEVNKNNS